MEWVGLNKPGDNGSRWFGVLSEILIALTTMLFATVWEGCSQQDAARTASTPNTPKPEIVHPEPLISDETQQEKLLYPVRTSPQILKVPGFNDASFVTPSETGNTPRPVIIVLHGNFDRPEWQCDMWRDVASWHGWVLCPRGVRTPWATIDEDRWTYQGGAKQVSREMSAALLALEQRFPGAINRQGAVLAGFSLGANLLPEIVKLHPKEFETIFFIEGGLKQLDSYLFSIRRNGVKQIGLAMSTVANRKKIPGIRKKIKKSGLRSVYVDMRGAGHNYRMDFGTSGKDALRQLLQGEAILNDDTENERKNRY